MFTNEREWTPLHLASQNNMTDTVNLLLKHGANVNSKVSEKWTAMHIACFKRAY